MTHEPECADALLIIKGHTFGMACICEPVRAAYQRGRKDAATAVESVNRYDAGFGTDSDWCHIRRDEAIAAARGDGEQA